MCTFLKKRVFNFCCLLDNRSLYLLETSSSIKLLNSSFHFRYFSYYKKKTIARSLSMNHNPWYYSYYWYMVNLLNQQSFYAIVNTCLHFLLTKAFLRFIAQYFITCMFKTVKQHII